METEETRKNLFLYIQGEIDEKEAQRRLGKELIAKNLERAREAYKANGKEGVMKLDVQWPTPNLSLIIILANSIDGDKALDSIYDAVNAKMSAGEFSDIDAGLSSVQTDEVNTDILIGLLTVTSHCKLRLDMRADFYRRAQASIIKRGEDEPDLFDGLE